MSDYERGVRDERERIISLFRHHKEWLYDCTTHADDPLEFIREAERYVEAIEKIRGE